MPCFAMSIGVRLVSTLEGVDKVLAEASGRLDARRTSISLRSRFEGNTLGRLSRMAALVVKAEDPEARFAGGGIALDL